MITFDTHPPVYGEFFYPGDLEKLTQPDVDMIFYTQAQSTDLAILTVTEKDGILNCPAHLLREKISVDIDSFISSLSPGDYLINLTKPSVVLEFESKQKFKTLGQKYWNIFPSTNLNSFLFVDLLTRNIYKGSDTVLINLFLTYRMAKTYLKNSQPNEIELDGLSFFTDLVTARFFTPQTKKIYPYTQKAFKQFLQTKEFSSNNTEVPKLKPLQHQVLLEVVTSKFSEGDEDIDYLELIKQPESILLSDILAKELNEEELKIIASGDRVYVDIDVDLIGVKRMYILNKVFRIIPEKDGAVTAAMLGDIIRGIPGISIIFENEGK